MKLIWVVFMSLFLTVPNTNSSHHEMESHDENSNELEEKHGEHGHSEHEGDPSDAHDSHDEHGEEIPSQVGPDKAVTAWDPDRGIQLSSDALHTMSIKTTAYSLDNPLPKEAFVFFQDEVGVYRLRDGWFSLVEGTVQRGRFRPHKKQDLLPSDHVVIQGAGFLRVTELDLATGETSGHAH